MYHGGHSGLDRSGRLALPSINGCSYVGNRDGEQVALRVHAAGRRGLGSGLADQSDLRVLQALRGAVGGPLGRKSREGNRI